MTRVAQLLLVASAAALWLASRMVWVEVGSFDGLTHPKTTEVTGATWSTALLPLAVVALVAAVAALAVHGWPLRVLALLVAVSSGAMAYLAVGFLVMRDVAVRAARLADVPITELTGTERHSWGAVVTLAAAVGTLAGAVLLVRTAAKAHAAKAKYVAPAARRAAAQSDDADSATMSERMIWDALDDGADPTRDGTDSDKKGR